MIQSKNTISYFFLECYIGIRNQASLNCSGKLLGCILTLPTNAQPGENDGMSKHAF